MKFSDICTFILFASLTVQAVIGQPTSEFFRWKEAQVEASTEGVLINNQPALKINTPRGGSMLILSEKRDGEESLVFPVVHMHQILYAGAPGETGLIYVTKRRVRFVPQDGGDHSFNVARSEIKKVEFSKSSRFGRNVGSIFLIETDQKNYRFGIAMAAYGSEVKHEFLQPFFDVLQKAISDFDVAMHQFHQLTAVPRQLLEEKERTARAQTEQEIQSQAQYDANFKEALKRREELLKSIPPEAISSARAALKSLRKISGATEIGVNSSEYSSRVIDVKADVDEAAANLPSNALQVELSLTMKAYVDAAKAWNEMIKYDFLLVSDELGSRLQKEYSIPSDKSLQEPTMRREVILNTIWHAARVHLDRAFLLLN